MNRVNSVAATVLSSIFGTAVAEPVRLVCTDFQNPALMLRYTLDVEAKQVSNLFLKVECAIDDWSETSIKFNCGPGGSWKSELDRSTGVMRHTGAMAGVFGPSKCEKDQQKF